MRTIGLIGGMSWLSTVEYYSHINRLVNDRLGGSHSAKCYLASLDFGQICANNASGDHESTGLLILEAAQKLEASGCEVLAICANTMHMHAERIRSQVPLELVHIAEATAEAITQAQIKSIGLLGTMYVMEGEFYLQTLQNAGLRVLIPDQGDREFVHTAIYDELTQNRFVPETKSRLLAIIERLQADGAEGAILGCTELPLIVAQPESALPLFDTTKLHADAVVARAFA